MLSAPRIFPSAGLLPHTLVHQLNNLGLNIESNRSPQQAGVNSLRLRSRPFSTNSKGPDDGVSDRVPFEAIQPILLFLLDRAEGTDK